MPKVHRVLAVLGATLSLAVIAAPAQAQSPPPNDTIAGATVIASLPYLTSEDTTSATADSADTEVADLCGVAPTTEPSVWFDYTPASNQTIQVDTSASSAQTAVGVVTGAPGRFEGVACFLGGSTLALTAGQTYHMLFVVNYGNSTGGTLQLSMTTAPPPPQLHLTLDRVGHLNRTGTVTLTGTETCEGALLPPSLSFFLRQAGERDTIFGSPGAPGLACDGASHAWSVEVIPAVQKFVLGRAMASVNAITCGQAGCISAHVDHIMTLRR